eukprot:gnl/TRDRNA2_/TRDRNA2_172448_c0_seq2.p1 gnl/TRDRNA2_/TRDRNA2_172448_c0~~gnl/TRDRNA2_/TRDRNA2_172448_c0_seq2.p1  ORF type:complete len:123 (-),score=7.15 gnl/TRDRNA2_/TRDRNA2_172448_c0_seq2:32-400(-)
MDGVIGPGQILPMDGVIGPGTRNAVATVICRGIVICSHHLSTPYGGYRRHTIRIVHGTEWPPVRPGISDATELPAAYAPEFDNVQVQHRAGGFFCSGDTTICLNIAQGTSGPESPSTVMPRT